MRTRTPERGDYAGAGDAGVHSPCGITVLGWNKGWPHWYSLWWLIVWPVGCWVGLKLAGHRNEMASA